MDESASFEVKIDDHVPDFLLTIVVPVLGQGAQEALETHGGISL